MMVISMELKARVARFSPKRIAKAFAGRFSDSVTISNIGILELFFQGQHLGTLPDFIDQVKPKSQGRQPRLTSSSCSNMLPLWNPLKPPKSVHTKSVSRPRGCRRRNTKTRKRENAKHGNGKKRKRENGENTIHSVAL